MQRIDENTYIDDTLVTCAEYQLFIDEMREQGKYYQPDHWTSYRFPEGQAHEPILGVRHSDAVEFCLWLSNRENKGWAFRLPTKKEGDTSFVKHVNQNPLGFWVRGNSYQFSWVFPPPSGIEPFDFDMSHNREQEVTQNINEIRARSLRIYIDNLRNRNFSKVHEYAENLFHHLCVLQTLFYGFAQADNRIYKIQQKFPLEKFSPSLIDPINNSLREYLAFGYPRFYSEGKIADSMFEEDIKKAIELSRNSDFLDAILLEINQSSECAKKLSAYFKRKDLVALNTSLSQAYDILSKKFVLVKRVNGYLPVFEGIRLVKYRE